MVKRDEWSGTASDFLRAADRLERQQEALIRRPDWPRTPRALAGRLRRTQTLLRAVGINIGFQREGRNGSVAKLFECVGSRQDRQHRQ